MTTQSEGIRVFGRDGKAYVRQLVLHNCFPDDKTDIEIKVQRGKFNAEGNVELLEDAILKPVIDKRAKTIIFHDVFVNKEFGMIVSLRDGGKVQFSPEFEENELLRFSTLEGQELNVDAFAIVDKLP